MVSKGVVWFSVRALAVMVAVVIIAFFPRESSKIPIWIWSVVVIIMVVITVIYWYRLVLTK